MDHLSDMMALLVIVSLGVVYLCLHVVVDRRQRAQRLAVEQLKEKYRDSAAKPALIK
jgi:Na+/H+ antiporter NhaD/arsenite permease-like protein